MWEGWCSNPSGSRPNFFRRQHLTFDKGGKCVGDFRGIVRFWKGWRGARDGGEAIPPVVARILSGDSTSPLTRDGHGCPKLNAQSFARMRNQHSVHMARMWCGARVCCPFTMVVGMERVNATEAIPPVVARILSGDSTSL